MQSPDLVRRKNRLLKLRGRLENELVELQELGGAQYEREFPQLEAELTQAPTPHLQHHLQPTIRTQYTQYHVHLLTHPSYAPTTPLQPNIRTYSPTHTTMRTYSPTSEYSERARAVALICRVHCGIPMSTRAPSMTSRGNHPRIPLRHSPTCTIQL